MTENVMNVIQPVELFFEEDEKVNFFFHIDLCGTFATGEQ